MDDAMPPLAAGDALFLDFDGTLAPIAPAPDLVVPRADVPAVLRALVHVLGGAVAVITGRRLADVDGFLGVRLPGVGLHGAEWRFGDGPVERLPPPPSLAEVRRRLVPFAERHPDLLLEDKGLALALHWRRAPHLADACGAAVRAAVEGHDDLEVMVGKAVHEVRRRGVHKGAGIARLLERPPFAGRRPVFAGDDTTDEDGFALVQARGGFGVKVGPGPTTARHRVPDVDAFLDWLAGQAVALGGQG